MITHSPISHREIWCDIATHIGSYECSQKGTQPPQPITTHCQWKTQWVNDKRKQKQRERERMCGDGLWWLSIPLTALITTHVWQCHLLPLCERWEWLFTRRGHGNMACLYSDSLSLFLSLSHWHMTNFSFVLSLFFTHFSSSTIIVLSHSFFSYRGFALCLFGNETNLMKWWNVFQWKDV